MLGDNVLIYQDASGLRALNRFRTGQGRSGVNLVRWGQATDPTCGCGAPQTMSHIVNECPLTRLWLEALYHADQDAVQWLRANKNRSDTILG